MNDVITFCLGNKFYWFIVFPFHIISIFIISMCAISSIRKNRIMTEIIKDLKKRSK